MAGNGPFIAFLSLQMFGFCGCVVLIMTALLSRTVPRQHTWFSFMISWAISAASYCLLLLAGQMYNPQPPHSLCLAQAALIYAAPPLTAATTVGLVSQAYFNVRNWVSDVEIRGQKESIMVLLSLPYLMHAAMLVGCLTVGSLNPGTVRRAPDGFYCNFVLRVPSKISSITVAVLMIPTLALQVATFWYIKRNWNLVKGSIIRVLVFSIIGIVVIVLGIIFASVEDREPELNLVLASIPVAAVLIFGTQGDMLQAWMLRKRKQRTYYDTGSSLVGLTNTFSRTSV